MSTARQAGKVGNICLHCKRAPSFSIAVVRFSFRWGFIEINLILPGRFSVDGFLYCLIILSLGLNIQFNSILNSDFINN